MLAPYLSAQFYRQSDFGHPAGAVVGDMIVSDFRCLDFPKIGLVAWIAASARRCGGCCFASSLAQGLTEEADDAEGHRQMVQSNQGLRVPQTGDRKSKR